MKKSKSLREAINKTKDMTRWRISPYNCLYHDPSKYNIVHFARWAQRYSNFLIYKTLLAVSDITGYEPVPAELLQRHAARMKLSGRKIRVGKLLFYLVKPDEMTRTMKKRYLIFKEFVLNDIGKIGESK